MSAAVQVPLLARPTSFVAGQVWLTKRGFLKRVVGFNAGTQAVLCKGVDGDGRKEFRTPIPTDWSLVDEPAYRKAFGLPEVTDFEVIARRDIADHPYEVSHDEGEGKAPTFKTMIEARTAAATWNRDCPGHVARRRRS